MLTEFYQSVEISIIEIAIYLHRKSLRLQPSLVVSRTAVLCSLAEALVIRFQVTDKAEYLDQAIEALEEALQFLPPPDPTRYRVMLHCCACLFTRFGHFDRIEDLLRGTV